MVDRISNLRRIFRFYLSQERRQLPPATGPTSRMNQLRLDLAVAIQSRDGRRAEKATEDYILNDLDDWARVV